MAFQPAGSLGNRTFFGLITAQFLAGFNDQAIHAMAMFYAINTAILSEGDAISLMPILFYAPWAIFATLAGYFSDRYSKTYSLIGWKISEIVISLMLILGFYLGTNLEMRLAGGWIVMSCVFLMGTHAAFFAPAKYGSMPEILQAQALSRGNGILESTTFLASILGTVTGGFLSYWFRGNELWIGFIMLALSLVGAAASFLIAYLPPANQTREFPVNLFAPLVRNLQTLFRSRALALSVTGIAFFIFMVAYMRGSVYMHGESRNPRWDESFTSLIVATVAFGVGIGSPLAGYLSGRKIELGLVPLGCLGMFLATFVAGLAIDHTAVLIGALVVIGFFSGFYMVPLYTMLQHRAPKTSKGDLVATSNFINVTGAITASILFKILVGFSQFAGIAPPVDQADVFRGQLVRLEEQHGHPEAVVVRGEGGVEKAFRARQVPGEEGDPISKVRVESIARNLKEGDAVVVSAYELRGIQNFLVRRPGQEMKPVYDFEILPRFLFLIASMLTLGILILLWRMLPDFFTRSLFWLRSLGKYQLREVGLARLPASGPVLLACNCVDLESSLQLVSVTDRTTRVIVPTANGQALGDGLLGALARRSSVVALTPDAHDRAKSAALHALSAGHLVAVGVDGPGDTAAAQSLLQELRGITAAPVVPVFCGPLDPADPASQVRVIFGPALAENAPLPDLRQEIHKLGDWVRRHDATADVELH